MSGDTSRGVDDALTAALGRDAVAGMRGLAVLDPAARAHLARLVGDARDGQRRQVQQAIDEALTHIPAILRAAIRKLLFS